MEEKKKKYNANRAALIIGVLAWAVMFFIMVKISKEKEKKSMIIQGSIASVVLIAVSIAFLQKQKSMIT